MAYDYQDGFKFGGVSSSSLNLMLIEKDVPFMPEIAEQSEEMAGLDGGYDFGIQYKPKIIGATVRLLNSINKTDYNNKLRNLAGILNPRLGAKEIIFDDEPDKMYYGRLTENFTPDRLGLISQEFTLSFICYDPFTYGVTEKIVSGASGSVNQLGSHVNSPTILVTKTAGAATMTFTHADTSKEVVKFNAASIAGTYIINSKEKTTLVNGVGAYQYLEVETYPTLPPLNNTFAKTGSITTIEVRYRDTWL